MNSFSIGAGPSIKDISIFFEGRGRKFLEICKQTEVKKCRHVRAFITKLLFYTIWSFKKTVVVVNIFYRNSLIRKQVKYVKFNLHVQMTEKFMTYNGSRQQIWNFPIPFIRRRVWSKKHQPRRRFMWKSSLVTKLSHFSDEIISSPKGCRSMDSRFPS